MKWVVVVAALVALAVGCGDEGGGEGISQEPSEPAGPARPLLCEKACACNTQPGGGECLFSYDADAVLGAEDFDACLSVFGPNEFGDGIVNDTQECREAAVDAGCFDVEGDVRGALLLPAECKP